ncbi:hypothetical protein HPB51_009240 [Rhipicephalus microplus]|uniref:Uncharacterized protein n=1 Tax=Rhipicephalus microplus TaxID=6941 RepID=A0A9J6F170_RHIMP|nr:hypothetical protein HPB51_009240 [Rhipicephalus microplus]
MPANAHPSISSSKSGSRRTPSKASLPGVDAERGADAKPREHGPHFVPVKRTATLEKVSYSAELTPGERPRPQDKIFPMPLISLVPCWVGSLCVGTALGYSLPAGRSLHLAKDSGAFDITHAQIFWFGSLMALGAVFGSLGGAFLTQRFGRRWSFVTSALRPARHLVVHRPGTRRAPLLRSALRQRLLHGLRLTRRARAYSRNVSRSSPRHRRKWTTLSLLSHCTVVCGW